eukprot:91318-Chlamydomonas_euryale.AAC.2
MSHGIARVAPKATRSAKGLVSSLHLPHIHTNSHTYTHTSPHQPPHAPILTLSRTTLVQTPTRQAPGTTPAPRYARRRASCFGCQSSSSCRGLRRMPAGTHRCRVAGCTRGC